MSVASSTSRRRSCSFMSAGHRRASGAGRLTSAAWSGPCAGAARRLPRAAAEAKASGVEAQTEILEGRAFPLRARPRSRPPAVDGCTKRGQTPCGSAWTRQSGSDPVWRVRPTPTARSPVRIDALGLLRATRPGEHATMASALGSSGRNFAFRGRRHDGTRGSALPLPAHDRVVRHVAPLPLDG